jgi:hypothetical protein
MSESLLGMGSIGSSSIFDQTAAGQGEARDVYGHGQPGGRASFGAAIGGAFGAPAGPPAGGRH